MRKISVLLLLFTVTPLWSALIFSPGKIPFSYDPNQIIGKKMGGVQIEATEFMIVGITVTHDKGFPFIVTIVSAPPNVYLVANANDWKLQWTTDVNDVGVHYITLEVTDAPPAPWMPKTRQGTIAIEVIELNPGPILHELIDTPVAMHDWPGDYQKRWQELKKKRTILLGPIKMNL